MRDVIGFGTVLAAILAGILLNRSDVKELCAELLGEIKDLNGKIDSLRTEMHGEFERFSMTFGEHEA